MTERAYQQETKPLFGDVRRIESMHHAEQWLAHLMQGVKDARAACDVVIPDDLHRSMALQRSAERKYLITYGSFLGTLRALHACNLLSDLGYERFRQEVMATAVPTVVGKVGS